MSSIPSKLGDQQRRFMSLLPRLIDKIYESGYAATLGDGYRDPRASFPYSHPNSLHNKRLAIDILIFKDGVYLTDSEDYRPFGEYWQSLDPGCTWGGEKDGNHFSYAASKHGMTF